MKLKEIVELLDARVANPDIYNPDKEITFAFSCDLMSDALMLLRNVPMNYCEHGMLITGLATVQGVRTAEMLDLAVILVVRGKNPIDNVINVASESNVIVICTDYTMFSSNGKLYANGIKGISEL